MESYQVITLKSGQPLILYQENEKVYMYTVYSGRIRSYGIIFDDVSEQLHLFSSENQYACYISMNGKLKLYRFQDMRFVELLTFPGAGDKQTELKQIDFALFDDQGVLFYLIHNLNDSSNALYYISLNSINTSSFVFQGDYSLEKFVTVPWKNQLILFLYFGAKIKLLLLNEDKTVEDFTQSELMEKKTDVSLKEKEQLEILLKEKEKEINSQKKLLYEKDNKISSLESTQKHIENQYNELAEFAGQLQEELRKARYL